MARTYYKYAEKQADSQVNWFQVGKDLTDMLKKETEVREQKKAAIDEASRQFGQELENAPQGNSDDVNQWTTNYASDMQQYRLMTDKLLKSGQLKVKDYTLIRQNTMDGTKNLFNLSKEYQAEFDEKTRRRDEDKSSASEGQFLAMVEGFANLNQTKALINPTTGAISVGKMEKGADGVLRLKQGPDNYMTVNQLRNRIKEKIDKYQLNDALAGEVKLMGEVVNEAVTKTGSATQTGFMTKITDPTMRKGLSQEGQQAVDAYMNLENKIVQSKLSNPRHTSSILFDWSGGIDPKTNKPYQVTLDKDAAAKDSSLILWGYKDGIFQPDFETTANGKEQYKQAEEYTKKKLRGMLEQKTELTPFQQPRKEQPQEWQYRAGQEQKQQADALSLWQQIYSGSTTGAKETAKQGLLGTPQALQQGLLDIDISDGKTIKLIYADPIKNRTIKMVDDLGNPVSGDQFAASGVELHGVTDRNKFSRFRGEKFATQGVNWKGVSSGRAGQPVEQPAKPAVRQYAANKIKDDLFTMKSVKAARTLQGLLSNFTGFKVEDIGGTFGNDVRVTSPDGATFIFNANDAGNAADSKAGLIDFISGKVTEEKAKELIKLGVLVAPAQQPAQAQTTVNYGEK